MKFLSNVDLVWGWDVFTRAGRARRRGSRSPLVLSLYLVGLSALGRAPRLGRPGASRLASAIAAALALASGSRAASPAGGSASSRRFCRRADLGGRYAGRRAAVDRERLRRGAAPRRASAEQRRPDRLHGLHVHQLPLDGSEHVPAAGGRAELARYVRVRLYTDGRGEPYRGFQQMEQTLFGTVALPYYAMLTPDGDADGRVRRTDARRRRVHRVSSTGTGVSQCCES